MNPKRLYVLDANALLHRAWHAIPPLTTSDGRVVNAVYGVLMLVLKLWQEEHPDAMVACWDTATPTFRHEAFEAYKAQREKQADELYAQIPWTQEGLKTMSVESVFADGYEADDIIATIATRSHKQGWRVTIVTSDRDSFQLIRDGIDVLALKKGVSDTVRFDLATLKKEFGLTPEQFIDYKIMRGDPSDNIPGVKGIGEKGATQLLQQFGDLATIMREAHDVSSEMTTGTRKKLLEAEHELEGLRELIVLKEDAPVDWQAHETMWPPEDLSSLRSLFQSYGFNALLKRLDVSGGKTSTDSPASASKKERRIGKAIHATAIRSLEEWNAFIGSLPQDVPIFVRVDRAEQASLFGSSETVLGFGYAEKKIVGYAQVTLTSDVCKAVGVWISANAGRVVMHDAKREMHVLALVGVRISAPAHDLMLSAYLLTAGERNHDLEQIATTYAGMHPSATWTLAEQVEAMMKSFEPVNALIKEHRLEQVLSRFDIPLIPVLFNMERAGILLDRDYVQTLEAKARKEQKRLEESMRAIAGAELNPASPKQLGEALFGVLGLPTKNIKKSTHGYSTASSELEKLRGQHPIIELIEEYREVSKLLSTYIDVLPMLADEEGRVHTTFHQAVTATGRLSSSDPNLQNIPIRSELGREIRRAFIAKKGQVLVSCDYSQIELRVIAGLAKDQAMISAFERGEDIHRATASAIWNIPLSDVTTDQRRIAKAINFGLIFGQGPQGLSQTAGISFAEAKTFIAKYFDVYTGIKSYMDRMKAFAHEHGYVETLFGRKRLLPDIHSSIPMLRAQAERMAINMPVQGTDADLMKLAMIEVEKRLPKICPKASLVLQVHDELIFEVPKEDAKHLAKEVCALMEHAEDIGVPVLVEAKIGANWADMEKLA